MQNVKGTYDYFGKEQAVRQHIQATLQELFKLYDFESMDTTLLNEQELLASKYAGGDEILKEMYQLTDQGGRSLALRYDLTIPFAKVIALNPGIEFPYKRYEMGKVFRDGPVKRGRLREFLQCDADVVGIAGPEAEAELMQLAAEVFGRLELPVVVKWNNRRFMGELLGAAGVPPEAQLSVMLTLDKLAKIGSAGVSRELADKGLPVAVIGSMMEWIEMENPGFEQLCGKFNLAQQPGAVEVLALQQLLRDIGLEGICRFDPFLSRGLSFYTGTVYEIFDASGSYTSSLGGGGRYDAIIGQLVGRADIAYSAVGLSFGMESLMALLGQRTLEPAAASVMIIPLGATLPQALLTAAKLRSGNIRTSLDTSRRKLKKMLAAASSKGIPYVILIGDHEVSQDMLQLKDMRTGDAKLVTLEEALKLIR
ncbi:histidine--tRNA ligase [Paenibacillus albidus]|uniref:histidine--tRNA ligase n=1 Tax=Paenibacillus albidus TaxID=2041023 RepID=UPI001BE618AB|nr:histidine--tRNA ligase [Paenibacillus albidus]MBT2287696.1 histidine--tRNA ligase [Paenibacillus albidus]